MPNTTTAPLISQQGKPTKRPKKKRRSFGRKLLHSALILAGLFGLGLIWFFFTSSGNLLRNMAADTLITTQHRDWAKYIIGQKELQNRVDAYWNRFEIYSQTPVTEVPVFAALPTTKKPLVEIEAVNGKGYKGYIMSVSDPKKIRLAVPEKYGKGEKVSSMVKRTGAIAGVNGGGFIDPEGMGNGFQPEGIVISGGQLFYHDSNMNTPIHVVAIDKNGQMISGKHSPAELIKMNVSEAVTFAPRFIVNGVGQIKNQADGWGIAPRTCMAQKADGTILFAVIDGRQPGYSIGATLYDVQELLLARGAIIAANLDGGSSTVLIKNNQTINRPSSQYGERYLPTAWLVFDNPESIKVKNIWEGVDIHKIDPSKW